MTSLPSGFPYNQGLTQAQWQSWFTSFASANPKIATYTGSNATYKGKSWAVIDQYVYSQLSGASSPAAAAPGLTPAPKTTQDAAAAGTLMLIQTQALADGIGASVSYTATYGAGAVQAATQGAAAAANSIPGVSAITSVEGFLSALGDLNLWLRVAKVVIGGALLLVGVSKLTGIDNKVTQIATKAVGSVPFIPV